MTRDTNVLLPITYDGWDEAGDFGDIQYYEVKFTEDFGPWKKGDTEEYLVCLHGKGIVQSETKKVDVRLRPTS